MLLASELFVFSNFERSAATLRLVARLPDLAFGIMGTVIADRDAPELSVFSVLREMVPTGQYSIVL